MSIWKRACLYSIRKKGKTITLEGNAITNASWDEVLIHEKFAQRNGLAVGDSMLLGSVEDGNHTYLVAVTGIFGNTKEQNSIGIALSCDLYDNIVFTDLSTASFLLYGTNSKTSVQYGDFYVNDPDELDRIMAGVQEFPGVDWENCTLTRYDNDYQNAKESLKGLQSISIYRHRGSVRDLLFGAGLIPDLAASGACP